MNVIEFHTWNSTTRTINKPARVIFDIDPGEGTSWTHVKEAVTLLRALLEALGLKAWLKTSGGKGLYIAVPLAPRLDFDMGKDFAQTVVVHLARTIPSRFVAKSGAQNRKGKFFVDYCAKATRRPLPRRSRRRPGPAWVSMTISWEDLSRIECGSQWSIQTAREYLSFRQEDPWAAYWSSKQGLDKARKILDV